MKILVLSDVPSKWLWDFFERDKLEEYDLILSCGDLPAEYLSFLVTFAKGPLLYVHGNHDHYDRKPPEGCICIEDQIYEFWVWAVLCATSRETICIPSRKCVNVSAS